MIGRDPSIAGGRPGAGKGRRAAALVKRNNIRFTVAFAESYRKAE